MISGQVCQCADRGACLCALTRRGVLFWGRFAAGNFSTLHSSIFLLNDVDDQHKLSLELSTVGHCYVVHSPDVQILKVATYHCVNSTLSLRSSKHAFRLVVPQ